MLHLVECTLCTSVCVRLHKPTEFMLFYFFLKVLSINEEGLRRCEENTKVFGRPIR